MPKMESLVDRITKFRRAGDFITTDCGNVHENFLQRTSNGELFLHINTVTKSGKRNLIFTTYLNLQHLENADIWVCDGTFYACPKEFSQLYTIQGRIRNNFYPLLYCLLDSKESEGYEMI
jgi:hypothetical protein